MRPELRKVLEQLRDELPSLMRASEPDPQFADYKCAFCQMRPRTNHENIVHCGDCLGDALEKELADLSE